MKILFLFLVPLIITLILMPNYINFLKRKQYGQTVREDGPETHIKKNGTPTMAGVVVIFTITISSLLLIDMSNEVKIVLMLFVMSGIVGFIDDFLKIGFERNLGLTSKQKLFGQIFISLIFVGTIKMYGMSTEIVIPFMENPLDLGIYYYLFVVFLIVGTTNATNLTDGLDGLLGGTSVFAFAAVAFIAYMAGYTPFVELSVIIIATLIGFLVFNIKPAKIFMGDVGSLAIGGLIAATFIMLKIELLLLVIGAVFVIETLSVIVQVAWFKISRKRIFKMTPLHHHYEEKGISEIGVVRRFWAFGMFSSMLGVLLIHYGILTVM